MTQGISQRLWQVEGRIEETKELIRDIKRIDQFTNFVRDAAFGFVSLY